MIVTQKFLPRRTFLRGLGITMALPLLDAMVPAMAATRLTAAKPAMRLGFVYVPNGIIQKAWLPSKEGAGFDFASTMKPLEPFREKLLVMSNLTQNGGRALGDGAGDHARAGASWLTGVHPKKTEGADIHAGISADQIAAKAFGKNTQFASLEIGLEEPNLAGSCDSGYSCAYTNTISWRIPHHAEPHGDQPARRVRAPLRRRRNQRSRRPFEADEGGSQHPRFHPWRRRTSAAGAGCSRQEQAGRVSGRYPRHRTPHPESGRTERDNEAAASRTAQQHPRRVRRARQVDERPDRDRLPDGHDPRSQLS